MIEDLDHVPCHLGGGIAEEGLIGFANAWELQLAIHLADQQSMHPTEHGRRLKKRRVPTSIIVYKHRVLVLMLMPIFQCLALPRALRRISKRKHPPPPPPSSSTHTLIAPSPEINYITTSAIHHLDISHPHPHPPQLPRHQTHPPSPPARDPPFPLPAQKPKRNTQSTNLKALTTTLRGPLPCTSHEIPNGPPRPLATSSMPSCVGRSFQITFA
jgi:hypothetical protein